MPNTTGLFNKIAKHYDLLNTVFSLGIDRYWRRELAREVRNRYLNLDIATGTAEVALSLSRLEECHVIGIDPSIEMLKIGNKKIFNNSKINLVMGLNEHLPFPADIFDSVTIAFGIRNTMDLDVSLQEIKRVLKPGGKFSVLEFTTPETPVFRHIFLIYFNYIMPFVGWLFGSMEEYRYLSVSSAKFPQRSNFIQMMNNTGFTNNSYKELTFGIVSIYTGFKNS